MNLFHLLDRSIVALLGLGFLLLASDCGACPDKPRSPEGAIRTIRKVELGVRHSSYRISTYLPILDAPAVKAETARWLRTEMKKVLRRERKMFLAAVADTVPLVMDGRLVHATLENTCSVAVFSPDVISLRFDFELLFPRENPIHTTRTLNLVLSTRQSIGLTDLFDTHALARAVSAIASYSQQELNRKLQEDPYSVGMSKWISDGAAPLLSNFETFTVEKAGLRVIFEEYQVAAYVFGPQEVLIPWKIMPEAHVGNAETRSVPCHARD